MRALWIQLRYWVWLLFGIGSPPRITGPIIPYDLLWHDEVE